LTEREYENSAGETLHDIEHESTEGPTGPELNVDETDSVSGDYGIDAVSEEVNTEEMMSDFKGHNVVWLVTFAIIVHVVVILGGSVGFVINKFSDSSDNLSEEQRVKMAMSQATSALSKVAEKNELTVDKILDAFLEDRSPSDADSDDATDPDTTSSDEASTGSGTAETGADGERKRPLSEYEKQNLAKPMDGPELPPDDILDNSGIGM
jgi:hypothetical protein